MVTLAKLSAMISVLYIIKLLLYPFFKPVSGRQKKRARRFMKERRSEAFRERWTGWKRSFARKYVKNLVGPEARDRYGKMIERLDLPMKPEDIRLDQFLWTGGAILVTVVMFSANPLLGAVSGIFIVLGWLYPVSELEKNIERKNRNIGLDFPAFYSMVYYQYSKSVNIYLADVIKDYLPHANPDMAEELGVMLDNIEFGETYALKQLKRRVPLRYVIKFCDIMETRLRGYDNVSQMSYLKNELDEFRVRALEDELERRMKTNSRIQLLLIVILFFYIALYFLFTIMDSLRLFQ